MDGLEAEPVTGRLAEFDCRNNRLAQLGLRQDGFEDAVARGARALRRAPHRRADRHQHLRHPRDRAAPTAGATPATGALPAGFPLSPHARTSSRSPTSCAAICGLQGPAAAISTACSSSAKVFASAHRLIEAGFADAAVVGGVDSLCLTTLYGFGSLELLSREPCRPVRRASATASRSARRRASCCSSGRSGRAAQSRSWATAKARTATTCRRRTPRARACISR